MSVFNATLDGFPGWGEEEAEDLFAASETPEEKETEVKETEDSFEKIENESKEEKEEEKKEENLFKEAEEEEEEEEMLSSHLSTLELLKDKGLIDFELEEGKEITEEEADEILTEKFEESIDNRVKELMDELPQVAKDLLQFTLKGGNPYEFINTLAEAQIDLSEDVDLTDEDTQLDVMRELLRLEGKDEEEVETELEFLKDSNKLALMAEKKYAKYKAEEEANRIAMVKKQALAKEAEKTAIKEAKVKIATMLSESSDIAGLSLNQKDVREIPSYMNDRTVKLNNGNVITQMQKELFYDVPKNEKALVQLASLLRNRNADGTFNFESLVAKAESKVASRVKDSLRRNKSSIPSNSRGAGSSKKALHEYFN